VTNFCRNTAKLEARHTGLECRKGFEQREVSFIQKDGIINFGSTSNKASSSSPKEVIRMIYDSSFSIIAAFKRQSTLPLSLPVSSCFSFSPFLRMEF